jgi:vancomycin resistance protein VanW
LAITDSYQIGGAEMDQYDLTPKQRTKLRIQIGKSYFRLRRRLRWIFGQEKFAREKEDTPYRYSYIAHGTPLLRQLKDVDMQLQYNKITNLRIAAQRINNIILNPGETFSYWLLIGKPTMRKGYKKGIVLLSGGFHPGIGGGLCQLSNLIYWMTLHTPLTIVERYRHSYDVFPDSNRTQPFGSGATCVYNYRDLMIRNDTKQPFQLKVWLTDTELCGCFRTNSRPMETYVVYEKEHYIKRELFGKYSRHNVLYRKIYDISGNETGEEYITENHALMMYEPLIEDKQGTNGCFRE